MFDLESTTHHTHINAWTLMERNKVHTDTSGEAEVNN